MTNTLLNASIIPLKPIACARIKTLPLLVQLAARPLPTRRPSISVAVAMDCSGSMQGERIEALREGVRYLLNGLRDDDEVVLVSFQDSARNQLARCPVSLARQVAPTLLARLQAGGTTALYEGWELAARQLRKDAETGRLCRVVLMTDGRANKGLTTPDELAKQASLYARHGITTTTIGLGIGFNEELLQPIADQGLGSDLFAERAEDLAAAFASELALLDQLVVRDARLLCRGLEGITNLNEHARDDDGAWILPGVAGDTEGWALLELPMDAVIAAQQRCEPIEIEINVSLVTGERLRTTLTMPVLSEVSEAEWYATVEDGTVARRHQELRMAQLQSLLAHTLTRGEDAEATRLLGEMAKLAEGHAWLQVQYEESVAMMQRRDAALQKELSYKSSKLRKRMIMDEMQMEARMAREGRLPGYLQENRREGRSGQQ
jgi:Ca-activated chloride channel family protein